MLSPVYLWRLKVFTRTLTSTKWAASFITEQSKALLNLSRKTQTWREDMILQAA